MKKQNMFIRFLIVGAIGALVTISAAVGAVRAHADIEDYRSSIAQKYGTSQTVHFRECTGEPLFYNEPYGAYIYSGYVGYGMRQEDLQGIEILATGPEAKQALDQYCELENRADFMLMLTLVAAMFSVTSLMIVACYNPNSCGR